MKININHLTKTIEGKSVLKDICLDLESGKIYGLKGRNGSGKTMLMRAVSGLIRPTDGEVVIDGEVIRKDISFPRSMGILIESPGFIHNYSGYENLKALVSIKGIVTDDRIREVLCQVGLDPKDKRAYRKYSLGMKQKLGIAAAIVEDPELLILDEPTNALDEESREILKQILQKFKEKNALVIISCHDTEDLLEFSDVIVEIKEGQISSMCWNR